MTEEQLPYHERLRLIKLGRLPKEAVKKERKPIPKISKKKAQEIADEKAAGGESGLDKYFEYHMKHSEPVCEECGMRADWLVEPQDDPKKAEAYRLIWRACQAHVMPKKKVYGFPSLRNNLDNHLVLFPSWGGHLCGCHGFFDSNWYNATTMNVWPKAVEIFKKLYPFIPEKEKKNIPDVLLQTLK